ncbi:MAG: MoxR family ATPase [Spirochaetales bacterium]|nr:MoxR family ATPase [Spirochaetales bacterium]
MSDIGTWAERIRNNTGKVFYGKNEVVDQILTALLCGGHVLLEDVPGLGKTILARAVAASLGGVFNRIQATPDLLPNDILGVSVYSSREEKFTFNPGPIHSNVLLVDEINRATPRTQSAFLEAMAESQVSIEGEVRPLPDPFFLLATENPAEFEGTFPLPEAQKDRFFMTVNIGYPSRDAEAMILESQRRLTHPVNDLNAVSSLEELLRYRAEVVKLHLSVELRNYILDLVEESRISPFFHLGISPRGSLALYKGAQAKAAMNGRDYVIPEDIQSVFLPIMRQRVLVKAEHQIKGIGTEEALMSVLNKVEVPPVPSR